jgi:imidazolonepropionase-like amidohydrolase
MKPMFIKKGFLAIGLIAVAAIVASAAAQEEKPKPQVLFTNVNIFDGKSEELAEGMSVLVEGNLIQKIAKGDIEARDDATVIDGKGRTLIPGLHDMHVQFTISTPILRGRQYVNPMHAGAVGILRAKGLLMNGFTTVRDAGGSAKYIQKIVDQGLTPGPRVLSSEAWISQTGGHADFRALNDPHPVTSGKGAYNWYDAYLSHVVDGKTEMRRAVRENFRRGASQIKIMISGGVATETDPIHTVQFTPEEIRAAVEVAENWGSYVFAHVLNERSLIMGIENGLKGVEHVPMLNDRTAKLLIENDIMFGTSVTNVLGISEEVARKSYPGVQFEKWKQLRDQADSMLKTIQRNPGLLRLMTFSSDLVGPWQGAVERDDTVLKEFEILAKHFDDVDILRIYTSNGARYNSLAGQNHPYQEGPLGVIKEGAYADMLLVDGNPLEDITLLAKPDENLKIIMKDGKIYKNTL